MIPRSPICRTEAFAEAGGGLRLPSVLSVSNRGNGHSAGNPSSIPRPHFPLCLPSEPFRNATTQRQRQIQNP